MSGLVIGGLISWAVNVGLGVFVFSRQPRAKLHQSFGLLSLCIASWSLGSFLINVWSVSLDAKLWLLRGSYFFGVVLPPIFLWFVALVTNRSFSLKLTRTVWLISSALIIGLTTPLFIAGLRPIAPDGLLISVPGLFYYGFIVFFGSCAWIGFSRLLKETAKSAGMRRNQLQYVSLAYLIALGGGINYFLSVLHLIPFYPVDDYILVIAYGIIAYTIVRYHLMDIRIALTRGAIFVIVYGLAVALPLVIAGSTEGWLKALLGDKWWLVPYGLLAAFASVWPLLYEFFQGRAEGRLLKGQRRYQTALRTISEELIGFTEAEDLRQFVGKHVADQMQLSSAELLIQADGFVSPLPATNQLPPAIQRAIQRWFARATPSGSCLLAETLGHADVLNPQLLALKGWMDRANIAAVVPGWLRGKVVTCLLLGPKRTKDIFSQEDFEVLGALARQSALVITNLRLYEEVAEQKRMAGLGELVAAMGHEFRNVFNIISTTLCTIVPQMPEGPDKTKLTGIIEEDIPRGAFIVKAIGSCYTKMKTRELRSFFLTTLMAEALEAAREEHFAASCANLQVTTTIPSDLTLQGYATLPDLMLNLLRGIGWLTSTDPGSLTISAQSEDDHLRLQLELATSRYIRAEDLVGRTFGEPAKHGGIYFFLCRLIVTDHQGRFEATCQEHQGATFTIHLPMQQPASAATASAEERRGPSP